MLVSAWKPKAGQFAEFGKQCGVTGRVAHRIAVRLRRRTRCRDFP
jgi:hypothetical protein